MDNYNLKSIIIIIIIYAKASIIALVIDKL
jgi:hypothetical protein